jgi:hypothetical protein
MLVPDVPPDPKRKRGDAGAPAPVESIKWPLPEAAALAAQNRPDRVSNAAQHERLSRAAVAKRGLQEQQPTDSDVPALSLYRAQFPAPYLDVLISIGRRWPRRVRTLAAFHIMDLGFARRRYVARPRPMTRPD